MSLFEVVAFDKDKKKDVLYQTFKYLFGKKKILKKRNRYNIFGCRLRKRYQLNDRCSSLTLKYKPCKNKKIKNGLCHVHKKSKQLFYYISMPSFSWK